MTFANKYVYARVLINMDNSCMLLPDLLFITRFLFISLFLIIIFVCFITLAIPRALVFRSPDCGIFIWLFREHLMETCTDTRKSSTHCKHKYSSNIDPREPIQ